MGRKSSERRTRKPGGLVVGAGVTWMLGRGEGNPIVRRQGQRLTPDVLLDIRLSAICSRNQYAHDPTPLIDELRRIAGERTDILARVAGTWAGYYDDEYTCPLATALRDLPGAETWTALSKHRRGIPPHKNP